MHGHRPRLHRTLKGEAVRIHCWCFCSEVCSGYRQVSTLKPSDSALPREDSCIADSRSALAALFVDRSGWARRKQVLLRIQERTLDTGAFPAVPHLRLFCDIESWTIASPRLMLPAFWQYQSLSIASKQAPRSMSRCWICVIRCSVFHWVSL